MEPAASIECPLPWEVCLNLLMVALLEDDSTFIECNSLVFWLVKSIVSFFIYNYKLHYPTLINLLYIFTSSDYRCGSNLGWSSIYSFTSVPDSANWSPKLAVYGDMGADNPQSLPRLQKEAQQGLYDAVFHIGDFGYDLYEQDGQLGDRFIRQIEPIAAYVPYMTAVGNHEEKYNFSHYKARFSMPGSENSLFYSFNLGAAHHYFIIIFKK